MLDNVFSFVGVCPDLSSISMLGVSGFVLEIDNYYVVLSDLDCTLGFWIDDRTVSYWIKGCFFVI